MDQKEVLTTKITLDDPDLSGTVVAQFLAIQGDYSGRSALIFARERAFIGDHWDVTDEPTDEYHLVINYVRRIVLGYASMLANAPKPKVPGMKNEEAGRSKSSKKEKMLLSVWRPLMKAWFDAELSAGKLGCGVVRVLWDPDPDQPENVIDTVGEDSIRKLLYTKVPFSFTSVPLANFFPVYNSYKTPDDFSEVFRFDPARLVRDVEERYNVSLQPTGGDIPDGYVVTGISPTCDLVEYWDKKIYVLVALTRVVYEYQGKRRLNPGQDPLIEKEEYHVLTKHEHGYSRIPFFVLQNIRVEGNMDPTFKGTISDFDDIFQLNQHINHIYSEEAEGIMTHIHPPLVYQSESHKQNPSNIRFGAGEIIPIGPPDEEDLHSMDPPSEPDGLRDHIAEIQEAIRDIAFLGETGFGRAPSGTSGVTNRISMTPMNQWLDLKLPQRKEELEEICKFILNTMHEKMVEDSAYLAYVTDLASKEGIDTVQANDLDRTYFVNIVYKNLVPRDELAYQQNEIYKQQSGNQSIETTIANCDVEDVEAELERIRRENQDILLNPEKARAIMEAKAAQQQMTAAPKAPEQKGEGAPGVAPGTVTGGTGNNEKKVLEGPGQRPQNGFGPVTPSEAAFPRNEGYGAGNVTPYLGR